MLNSNHGVDCLTEPEFLPKAQNRIILATNSPDDIAHIIWSHISDKDYELSTVKQRKI